MRRRWLVNKTNPEFIEYLSRASSISPVLAQVLVNRGIKESSSITDFLNPSPSGLSDPFEMTGMREAVERIRTARAANEKVLIHGDYDTDGLTATAIVAHALRSSGIDAGYFIPTRAEHGYGFNPPSVELAKKTGASIILTVDCGISSFDAAASAKAAGIDVIITDHHEPIRKKTLGDTFPEDQTAFELPEALAVINPKLTPCSPLINLSGAGIAFKFAQALASDEGFSFSLDDLYSLFDLAALGTVADVVPLTGENRIIMKEGLKSLNDRQRPGIRALRAVSGLESRQVRAGLLSFTIVPRINAAGRMGDSSDVVRLLLSTDEREAAQLSQWLDGLNTSRQKIESEVYQDALSRIRRAEVDSVIVLAGVGWHPGVLGIVASRVAEEFCCPAFIFNIEDGVAKGSARSIPSFDICEGLSFCGDMLIGFGGHKQAAGIRLRADNIEKFEAAIRRTIKSSVSEDDLVPSLEIDANVMLSDITHGLIRELDQLEPFGYGNPEPLFGSKSLEVLNPKIVGNNHLKMRLKRNSSAIDSIAFDMGGSFGNLNSPGRIDAVFTPSINEWNGGRYIQLVVKAMRPSD
ncbi:MAG: single-stranded-DNA-specific exonuclease RecJ [Nitrospirae bacterium]|nr:single-stranded-DNA-specific exonuclease RecJ [Nitrospirota bacterium]